MPMPDTTNNQLLGFFRTKRVLEPFMIVFGIASCVLGAFYLENMFARIAVCIAAGLWTVGAMVWVLMSNAKNKQTDEENMVYLPSDSAPGDGGGNTDGGDEDGDELEDVILDDAEQQMRHQHQHQHRHHSCHSGLLRQPSTEQQHQPQQQQQQSSPEQHSHKSLHGQMSTEQHDQESEDEIVPAHTSLIPTPPPHRQPADCSTIQS